MSELELSLFRQRSHEALKQKARRGALVPRCRGRLCADRARPDREGSGSAGAGRPAVWSSPSSPNCKVCVRCTCGYETRALHCPSRRHRAAEGRSIVWRLPLYNTVHNILTNPVYAGAYAFGRTMSKVSVEDGRKRIQRGLRRPLVGMGRAAQGSARRLYHLERVREKPAGDCRQCDRQGLPRSEERYGAENCSWRGSYAVAIAAVKSMSDIVARRDVIIARALSSITALRGASHSAASVPMLPSARKCCEC